MRILVILSIGVIAGCELAQPPTRAKVEQSKQTKPVTKPEPKPIRPSAIGVTPTKQNNDDLKIAKATKPDPQPPQLSREQIESQRLRSLKREMDIELSSFELRWLQEAEEMLIKRDFRSFEGDHWRLLRDYPDFFNQIELEKAGFELADKNDWEKFAPGLGWKKTDPGYNRAKMIFGLRSLPFGDSVLAADYSVDARKNGTRIGDWMPFFKQFFLDNRAMFPPSFP